MKMWENTETFSAKVNEKSDFSIFLTEIFFESCGHLQGMRLNSLSRKVVEVVIWKPNCTRRAHFNKKHMYVYIYVQGVQAKRSVARQKVNNNRKRVDRAMLWTQNNWKHSANTNYTCRTYFYQGMRPKSAFLRAKSRRDMVWLSLRHAADVKSLKYFRTWR